MVADDALVESVRLRRALEEAEANAGAQPTETSDWATLAATIVGLAFPPARIAALGIVGFEVAKRAIEAWGRTSQSVDIHLVSMSEAEGIEFRRGHPKPDVLYIGHPGVPSRYCTPAEFHRAVFEHKFSEAVTLLMALGATTIEVRSVRGWGREFMGGMGVAFALPGATGSAGAEAGSGQTSSDSLLIKADLGTAGRKVPFIPDGLVWYPNEPLWQAIAKGRVEHRLTSCQLAVAYADDFGVNAELHAAVQGNGKGKAGLSLGGNWTDHEFTIWRIHAVFGEEDNALSAPPSADEPERE